MNADAHRTAGEKALARSENCVGEDSLTFGVQAVAHFLGGYLAWLTAEDAEAIDPVQPGSVVQLADAMKKSGSPAAATTGDPNRTTQSSPTRNEDV